MDEQAGQFAEVARRSGLECVTAEANDSSRRQLGRQSVMQRYHSSLTHSSHVNPPLGQKLALGLNLPPVLHFLLEVVLDGAVRVLDVLEAEYLFLRQGEPFERSDIIPREIVLHVDGGEPRGSLQQFDPAAFVHGGIPMREKRDIMLCLAAQSVQPNQRETGRLLRDGDGLVEGVPEYVGG